MPFIARNAVELVKALATRDPEPIRSVWPDLDDAVAQVVDRGLARVPEDRFSSAREMGQPLVDWLNTRGGPAVRLPWSSAGEIVPPTSPAAPAPRATVAATPAGAPGARATVSATPATKEHRNGEPATPDSVATSGTAQRGGSARATSVPPLVPAAEPPRGGGTWILIAILSIAALVVGAAATFTMTGGFGAAEEAPEDENEDENDERRDRDDDDDEPERDEEMSAPSGEDTDAEASEARGTAGAHSDEPRTSKPLVKKPRSIPVRDGEPATDTVPATAWAPPSTSAPALIATPAPAPEPPAVSSTPATAAPKAPRRFRVTKVTRPSPGSPAEIEALLDTRRDMVNLCTGKLVGSSIAVTMRLDRTGRIATIKTTPAIGRPVELQFERCLEGIKGMLWASHLRMKTSTLEFELAKVGK